VATHWPWPRLIQRPPRGITPAKHTRATVKGSRLAVAPRPSSRSSGVRKMLQAYTVPRQSMAVMPIGIISHRPCWAGSPNSRRVDDAIPLLHSRDVATTVLHSAPAWGA